MRKFLIVSFAAFLVFTGFFLYIKYFYIASTKFQMNYIDILPRDKGLILIEDLKSKKIIVNTNPILSKSSFKPGSLIKIITTFGFLKEKLITVEDKFKCNGEMKIFDNNYKCWKFNGHGKENILDTFSNSCNLFYIKYTDKLGIERFKNYLKLFGFKLKQNKYFSKKELSDLAIGESPYLYITPLNALELISRIAVNKTDNEMKLVKGALRNTVLRGTAKYLKNFKPEIAGKTGTSTQEGKKSFNQAWFIGYAPLDDPKIAFVVFVKQGYSFSDAVPMAEKMLRKYFNNNK